MFTHSVPHTGSHMHVSYDLVHLHSLVHSCYVRNHPLYAAVRAICRAEALCACVQHTLCTPHPCACHTVACVLPTLSCSHTPIASYLLHHDSADPSTRSHLLIATLTRWTLQLRMPLRQLSPQHMSYLRTRHRLPHAAHEAQPTIVL